VIPDVHGLRSILWNAIKRGLLAGLAAQVSVISALIAIDSWRKRNRPQGRVRRNESQPVQIGETEVLVYTYGEDLYADMLDAIKNAERRVLLETFIWKDDRVGQAFKRELTAAAARGIDVYVIFDTFANLVVPYTFKRFPASINVMQFRLFPKPWQLLDPRNYGRDHRKLLVIDGHTAFVGGYNIGAPYATLWRDTHVRLKGPSVWDIENAFVDFWNLNCDDRLPQLANGGAQVWDSRIRVHRNVPAQLIFPIRAMYLEAIDRAQRHIYMTHAYFIPDKTILHGLVQAAQRGVDVRILLPATSNHIVADWLARGMYTRLLAGGVKLLLYEDAMVHAKTATIDGVWSTIGTANIDRLSLLGNYEINVEFYSEALAQEMERIFEHDASSTYELTLDEWTARPLIFKLSESVLRPLRPLL
jgi:cardiolipin synthase A/B